MENTISQKQMTSSLQPTPHITIDDLRSCATESNRYADKVLSSLQELLSELRGEPHAIVGQTEQNTYCAPIAQIHQTQSEMHATLCKATEMVTAIRCQLFAQESSRPHRET